MAKRLSPYILILLIGCAGGLELQTTDRDFAIGTVARISDGDSIGLRHGIRVSDRGKTKHITSVRYIGVDTPERNEPYYKAASELNKSLVYGRRVKLVFDKDRLDKYSRLLAYVYVGDMFINAELVRRGYARASKVEPDIKFAKLFQQLEQEARDQRLGMWASDDMIQQAADPGIKPEKITEVGARFLASKNSDVFHLTTCQWAARISEGNRVYFQTYQEALSLGKLPISAGSC